MIIEFLNWQPSHTQKNYIKKLLTHKDFNFNKIIINISNNNDISSDNYHATINKRTLNLKANNYRSVIYFLFDEKKELLNKNSQFLQIEMKFRGIMIETARNKVINFNTFKIFINESIKNHLNIFQLYFECAIEYEETKNLAIGKITWKECQLIKKYCELNGIIFSVAFPNLGHLYDLLIQKKYHNLSATIIKSFNYSLYDKQMHYSLDPLNKKAIALSQRLVNQVLENINPKYINLCGDETFDLLTTEFAKKAKIVNLTPYETYQNFLIKTIENLISQDKVIMLWTDIFANHKNQKINSFLTDNIIGLTWNYHPQSYPNDFKFISDQKITQVNCFMADSCNEGIMNFISSHMNMIKLNIYYKNFKYTTIGLMLTIWNDCGSNNSLFSCLPLLYEFNEVFSKNKNLLGSSFSKRFLNENNLMYLQLIQSLTMIKCVTFKDILFWYEQHFMLTNHQIFNQNKFKNIIPQNCQISNNYLAWVKVSLQQFYEANKQKKSKSFHCYFQEIFLMIENFILNNALCNYIQKYELNLEVPWLAMNLSELISQYHKWYKMYIKSWKKNYSLKDSQLIPNIYQQIIEYFKEKIK